jgi:hypothetical protein
MPGDACVVCGGPTSVDRGELTCDGCGLWEEECICEAAMVVG